MNKSIVFNKIVSGLIALSISAMICDARVLFPAPDTLHLLPLLDTSIIKFSIDSLHNNHPSILEDFGEVKLNLDAFNGTSLSDTNYVSFHTLNDILYSLSSSRTNRSLQIPENITEQMSQQFSPGVNPVGIVAYKYSRTRHKAVENNYLEDRLGKLYYKHNLQGGWIDPYEDKYVMAFSPYMNIVGRTVTYTFDSSLRFSNLPITSMLFDPGDGQGFRTVNRINGSSISATYDDSVNQANLQLRIVLSGGIILNAHSVGFVVRAPSGSATSSIADYTEQFDTTYVGYPETVSALMSVKYANGASLTKPLIIAEGFDPFSDPDGLIGSDGSGRGLNNLDNLSSLVRNKLLSLDYDIIYVDWLDSRAPIQANAGLLMKVIKWVNDNKPATADNSILIGRSMGGLISRYALRTMERAGRPHKVKTYVSNDAPHFGVNVPMGYLYAIQKYLGKLSFLDNVFISDVITLLATIFTGGGTNHANTYIHEAFDLLEAPSVRQMLMHYVSPQLAYDSQMYSHFQDTLDILGFPQGDFGQSIINLAISNGGENDYSNSILEHFHFDGGVYAGFLAPVLGIEFSTLTESMIPMILGVLVLFTGPRLRIHVYPNYYKNSGPSRVYTDTLTWHAYHGVFEGRDIQLDTCTFFDAPSSSRVFDSDFGSYYSFGDTIINKTYCGATPLLNGYEAQVSLINKFMFVPTVSSLAYRKKSFVSFWNPDDRMIDFEADAFDRSQIPFDGYKIVRDTSLNYTSTYHTQLNAEDIEWIDRMSQVAITEPPSILLSGYHFEVPDPKHDYSITWSVEDTDVAHINPSTGEITLELGGTTNVIADIDFKGGHFRLKKEFTMNEVVFPGFPTFTLSKTYDPPLLGGDFNGNYTIIATESVALDTTYTNHMTCHWGTKENTNSTIQWTTSSYLPLNHKLYFFCNFPNTATARKVYFYVSYQNQVSPTYSIMCIIPPAMFLLDDDGNLYTEDMDEPFAQVKGSVSENMYYFTCVDQTLVYDHWPTWAEFGQYMLENDEFVALIKTLKPWGNEELIMIPYSYHSVDITDEEYGVITVKYDDSL